MGTPALLPTRIYLLPLPLLVGLSAAGCYGAAPARPAPVALPTVAAGAHLSVDSHSTTSYEDVQRQSKTCSQKDANDCVTTDYTVKEPVTRTKTTASLGSTNLSYGQFKVLTDPEYDQKLVRLEEHSEACQEANLPRYIGLGLLLGGAAVYLAGQGRSSTVVTAGGIGMLGGIGSYTAGYFAFGGNRCVEAARLYSRVNHARDSDTMIVHGAATASEMKAVADAFNRRSGDASASR